MLIRVTLDLASGSMQHARIFPPANLCPSPSSSGRCPRTTWPQWLPTMPTTWLAWGAQCLSCLSCLSCYHLLPSATICYHLLAPSIVGSTERRKKTCPKIPTYSHVVWKVQGQTCLQNQWVKLLSAAYGFPSLPQKDWIANAVAEIDNWIG